jgi:hypothetical protein
MTKQPDDLRTVAGVIRAAKARHMRGAMAPAKDLTKEQRRVVLAAQVDDAAARKVIDELQNDFADLWPQHRDEFNALCKLA